MKTQFATAGLFSVMLCATHIPAHAVLGETYRNPAVTANPSLPVARIAAASVAGSALYQSHESRLPNGTVVREFADLQGIVFAVTWEGPTLPDLRDLLGNYVANFNKAVELARAQGQRRAAVNLRTNDIVLRSAGRMRAFDGFAYLPGRIPVGVNIDELLP